MNDVNPLFPLCCLHFHYFSLRTAISLLLHFSMPPFAFSLSRLCKRAVLILEHRFLTVRQLGQIQSNLVVTGAICDSVTVRKLYARYAIADLSYTQSRSLLRSVSDWNTVIRALSENGQPENVLWVARNMMRSDLLPDNYTFSFVLHASAEFADVALVLMYHSLAMRLGWEKHDYVQNGLIHSYASCEAMDLARDLLDTSCNRDVISWTTVMNGYMKIGEAALAAELFDKMPQKNAVSWSAMINGYAQIGMFTEALATFNNMVIAGIKPTHSAMVGALSACSHLGALSTGKWIHQYVDRYNTELDAVLGTALIDMYAKCGCIGIACEVFNKMLHRDVFAYTSLILGLADHCECESSLQLFRRMELEKISPNKVTFLGALTACSRMGYVMGGLEIFQSMIEDYGIVPEPQHYGCLVDLLGRAGLLEQADMLVNRMPIKPDSYAVGALLNACRVHGSYLNLEKLIVQGLKLGSLAHTGVQVLVSNIFASVNKWDTVQRMRKQMHDTGMKKVPGSSSLQVDDVIV